METSCHSQVSFRLRTTERDDIKCRVRDLNEDMRVKKREETSQNRNNFAHNKHAP